MVECTFRVWNSKSSCSTFYHKYTNPGSVKCWCATKTEKRAMKMIFFSIYGFKLLSIGVFETAVGSGTSNTGLKARSNDKNV